MSPFEEFARRVKRDLDAIGASWAFVGGLAVSTRGYPRFTNDVDVAVAIDSDPQAEKIVSALFQRGYQQLASLQRDDGRIGTIRLVAPPVRGAEMVLDLIFATTGVEQNIVRRAEMLAIFRTFKAPVASLGDLVAMKLLSVSEQRKKDDLDLTELIERSTPADLATTKEAIAAITALGMNRNKDLAGLLATYIQRAGATPDEG